MSSTQPPDNPDAEEEPTPPPPAAAEDRKALAALSHLETRPNEAEDEEAEAKQLKNKTVDQAQLSAAISRLEVSSDPSGNKGKGTERVKSEAELKREEEKRKELEEQRRRAKVKVDAADVGLLVEELDLTKGKATELLKMHEGDAVRAMRAFVKVSG